jgi:hypothetical protein
MHPGIGSLSQPQSGPHCFALSLSVILLVSQKVQEQPMWVGWREGQ